MRAVSSRRIWIVPILIDGHNLIGRLSTLSLRDPDDEEKLVRMLGSYRGRTGRSITVVFDPGGGFALPQSRRYRGIQVVFAPHGSSADIAIARRVQKSRDPRGWLVVTSDRDLATTVERLGARVQSADAFARELQLREAEDEGPNWKDESLSPDEIDDWLALFESHDGRNSLDDNR
jgi:predicted RNA-binding protein with PIN domain